MALSLLGSCRDFPGMCRRRATSHHLGERGASDHQPLTGWHDVDRTAAFGARYKHLSGGIGCWIDRDPQPGEPLTCQRSDPAGILADAGRENEGVEATERC